MNYKIIILLIVVVLLIRVAYSFAQNRSIPVSGMPVPDFILKDQNGNDFKVKDYAGKQKLVIFFYPKDESPVCTKEACAFRDSYTALTNAGAMVIGINSGSVASHKDFADHYNLPYTLLSDPGNKVLKSFGVKNALFLTGRETFIVDRTGKIIFRYRDMLQGSGHAKKALEVLQQAQ